MMVECATLRQENVREFKDIQILFNIIQLTHMRIVSLEILFPFQLLKLLLRIYLSIILLKIPSLQMHQRE